MSSLISYLIFGIVTGSIFSMTSIGFSFTWATAKIPNIAFVSFIYFFGLITAVLANMYMFEPIFLMPLNLLAGFLVGILFYKLIISSLLRRQTDPLTGLTLTFGLAIVLETVMLLIFGPDYRSARTNLYITLGNLNFTIYDVLMIISAPLVTLALYYLNYKTKWGLMVRALVSEPVGAALYGIDAERLLTLAYGISFTITGYLGIFLPVLQFIHPSAQWSLIPIAFIVSIVGGIGSLIGNYIIGVAFGLIFSLASMVMPGSWTDLIIFAFLIIVLLIKPKGLFRGLAE